MNRAGKGRRGEHEVRDYLKDHGYLVVRAAGSKGVFDLVAIPTVHASDKHTRVIQVKRGAAGVGKAERLGLEALAKGMPHARVEMWHRKDREPWRVRLWEWIVGRWIELHD